MKVPKVTSLYGRIFAIFWFTMFLVLIAVLIAQKFDPRLTHSAPKGNIDKLERIAEYISEEYGHHHSLPNTLQEIENRKRKNRDDNKLKIYLSDYNGNLISQHNNMQKRAIQNFITGLKSTDNPRQKLYGRFMIVGPVPVTIANSELLLYLGERWDRTPPFLLQLFDKPYQLLLVVMFVSTPLLLWLAFALSKPARRLQNAAIRVANGEFVEDPDLEKGSGEFKEAGAAFNQMVIAINQMMSGHQRLLSDISHELRSPLTRLRMANALATRKQGESSELKRIDTEAERLEKMIGELLELSRMQMNSHQIREKHSATTLWGDLIDDAQFEAEQVNKVLSYDSIPSCSLIGNPSLLMSAVENIVRNAIHYSQSKISVNFKLDKHALCICVEDDGEGVPESELQDIFRPFYRVSTARDRHSGGAGLGLAITESAIRQHNGSIKAERSPLGGLKVTISLPTQA